MILQSLSQHYQHLLERDEPGLSRLGYSLEKISYAILLAPDGAVVDVQNIRDASGKKPVPRLLNVPQPEKRTAGVKSNFLWDKTSYVLGVSDTSKVAPKDLEKRIKRIEQEYLAFKDLHKVALAGTDDPGLKALLAFLANWTPERFKTPPFKEEMLDANFVFRLDGERRYLHERPAAQAARTNLLADDGDQAPLVTCLVNGDTLPAARLHPPIKGVNGAQSSGASIVSFNLEAFGSYGKSQGENAPVSEQAAFAYTTVLNHLLRRDSGGHNRIQIADASVVFWAETAHAQEAEAAEQDFAAMLDPPPTDAQEAARIRAMLEHARKGRPLRELDPRLQKDTRMAVLGLAPNASRLSVRFWQQDTLDGFAQRLAQHEEDLRIEPVPWSSAPSARSLALATVPHRDGAMPKADDAFNNLVGELMRAVLTGNRYPYSLLANTLMRMRGDGNLSGLRVALCKGILTRNQRLTGNPQDKENLVSLDKQSLNPGYRLGRLFAVLEATQRAALGGQINATLRDRYYGAASATPASIFPVLLRNTQNHMSKLRKEKPGLAVTLEKDIQEIVDGLPEHFPRSLLMEDQGRFAIGYYHQVKSRFTKSDDTSSTTEGESE